jgi:cytidine deaminase
MAHADDDMDLILLTHARKAQANAYAPYSLFHVGAAILTVDGHISSGCNVENAAYPSGTCAEENAIGAMIAAGQRDIATILVVGSHKQGLVPCGACRQRIAEFGKPDTRILCAGSNGITHQFTLEQLLPFAFGRDTLEASQDDTHG